MRPVNKSSCHSRRSAHYRQVGASLIEVLVAMLILSFGMLALGGMLSYGIQMPKLSAYRAAAAALASSHVERMRANTEGFVQDFYKETMTYNHTPVSFTACVYPSCTPETIATLDKGQTSLAIQRDLPGLAGMRVTCDGACSNRRGDLWIIWQEPTTFSTLDTVSDECPSSSTAPTFTAFTDPKPRCLHVRFVL